MEKNKILQSEKLHEGRIFDLSQRRVLLPNGEESIRDVIEHNGAAAIIAVTDEGKLVMVRQYRDGPEAVLLEIPAGKLDPGEDPQTCALRELAEETGYRAGKIKKLFDMYPVAAYCSEQITIYLAEDLTLGATNLDAGEFVEIELFSLTELLKMIDNNELKDMKTILGILYYWRLSQ